MLIDTHCHLDAAEFDADREAVVESARQVGVDGFIVPAVERANFGAVASLCREYTGCFPAYGIHPLYVGRAADEDLAALQAMLAREGALAVGEIGLDRYVAERDDARQEQFFLAQLRLAREAGLPVILHVRRAVDAVLGCLRRVEVPGGIAHAFNGSRQQADEFIRRGFKLGFGGAMTFPRALRIRTLAAELPLSAIVLETDAPDMAPAWLLAADQKLGARNTPNQLPRIAETLAGLRRLPLSAVVEATTANAMAIFPRLAGAPGFFPPTPRRLQ